MSRFNLIPRKLQIIPIFLLLLAAILACQFTGGSNSKTPASPNATAAQGSGTQATNQSAGTPVASGASGLAQPDAGLEALTSYHQSFTTTTKSTYKGKPYESSTSVDRRVNAKDESSLVNATITGQKPVYLQYTRSGGETYVQQKAGQSCRNQDQANRPDAALDPAAQLPRVYKADEVGRETLDGLPAVHHHFTADAVRYQAGKNGTADGDVWAAQDGGAVLKYQLTVEIKDGDFTGTRIWTYTLSDVNKGVVVALPEGCLPLLSALPKLDNPANRHQ